MWGSPRRAGSPAAGPAKPVCSRGIVCVTESQRLTPRPRCPHLCIGDTCSPAASCRGGISRSLARPSDAGGWGPVLRDGGGAGLSEEACACCLRPPGFEAGSWASILSGPGHLSAGLACGVGDQCLQREVFCSEARWWWARGDPVSPAPPSPSPGRPAGHSGGRENRSPSEGSGSSPRKCFRCGGSGPRRPEGCGRSRVSGQPPLRRGSWGGGYPTKAPVAGPAILNLRKEVGAGTGRPVDRAGLRWPGQPRPLGLVARSSVAWRAGRFPVPPAPHLACPCSCPARGPGRGCGCRWTPLCLTGGGAAVRAPGGILG